jgi:hypothetical protein
VLLRTAHCALRCCVRADSLPSRSRVSVRVSVARSTANADIKTAVTMVKALQVGYPERLGLAVFLGAPRVFGLLWRGVRVLLDARTVSKARWPCCGAARTAADAARYALRRCTSSKKLKSWMR